VVLYYELEVFKEVYNLVQKVFYIYRHLAVNIKIYACTGYDTRCNAKLGAFIKPIKITKRKINETPIYLKGYGITGSRGA